MSAEVQLTSQATVFVVDDDDGVRRSLSRLVRAAGWNVETFSSAHDFLQREPHAGPGCLILDVQMAGMTGLQLRDALPSHRVLQPVIFLTAHGDVPTGVDAIKKGAVDFLLKPVDAGALLRAIGQAVDRHVAEQAGQKRREQIEARLSRLTPREREVLARVIAGRLNKQIADALGISLKTVKVHRARVMEKMEVDSVAALVHLCEAAGISVPAASTARPSRPQ